MELGTEICMGWNIDELTEISHSEDGFSKYSTDL